MNLSALYSNLVITIIIFLSVLFIGSVKPEQVPVTKVTQQASNTIFISNDTVIPFGDSMIINPGTTVLFTGHYSIHVQGKLIAIGSETDSIVFTISDTTGFSNIHSSDGGWNGIRFEDTPIESDSSIFSYCRFEFGKAVGDSANRYGGAVRLINFDKVRFSHSTFYSNYSFYWGGAIYAQKAHILLEYCAFTDNYSGNDGMTYGYGGAVCFVSSNPDITHSSFSGNTSTGIGGGISFEYSNPRMLNCTFKQNNSALGGGIGFLRCAPDRGIANILVYDNDAMFFGGGIANVNASPQMSNLTILSNFASMGGGFYCNEYSNPKLYNSILWGNLNYGGSFGSQVWIWDVYSEPGFYHCNIEYGLNEFGGSMFIGQYINNIDSNPLFTDWANQDFTLTQQSPCINSGTPDTTGLLLPGFDLAMHNRIIHGIIDMGAYEYDGPLGINNNGVSTRFTRIYPNPLQSSSEVLIFTNSPQKISLKIWDMQGKLLSKAEMETSSGNMTRTGLMRLFPKLTLVSGSYLIEINGEGWLEVHKVLMN